MERTLRCSGYELAGIEIVRAEDCTLTASDGREFVDFEAGVWAAALGHNHPRVNRVMREQLDRIGHIGYRMTNPHQNAAADEVLHAVEFDDGECVFLSSGSEAVEFAVQLSRRITGKPRLLTLRESFLGSYGSSGEKNPDEWILFDRDQCQDCPPERGCDLDCPYLATIPFDQVGAFVFEPGSSGGFVRFPPAELIRTLSDGVRAYGGLLVANEITTGVGRTGRWFGHHHNELTPDIVALGKGLGNGYPVSAVAMRRGVIDAIKGTDFHYAQSHQNDPMACAIAAEVLRTVREEGLVERSREVGSTFLQALEDLKSKHAVILEVRGRGLMLAIEFEPTRVHLEDVFRELLNRGILVGYKPTGNLFRFLPPLTIPEEAIRRLIDALDDILDESA